MRPSDKAQAAAGICRSESSEEMMRAFTVAPFAQLILHLSKLRAQSLHHGERSGQNCAERVGLSAQLAVQL